MRWHLKWPPEGGLFKTVLNMSYLIGSKAKTLNDFDDHDRAASWPGRFVL
jgi:hypothetical protein